MAGDMLKALAYCGVTVPSTKKRDFFVLCPVHQEKTPSCHVDLDKDGGVWHCFGCGAKGDAVKLVRNVGKVSYPEALRILGLADRPAYSARNSPAPPTRRADPAPAADDDDQRAIADARRIYDSCSALADTPAGWYCAARGIPIAPAAGAGVRYCPDFLRGGPAAVFPIFNEGGQLVAVQGRFIGPAPAHYAKRKKTMTRGRSKLGVFMAPLGAIESDQVIVTEAPIDALSMAAVGFAALATLGTGNLPDWVPARIGARSVYIALDNDKPGEEAKERWLAALAPSRGRIFWLRPDHVKDWNEHLTSFGPVALERLLIRAAFPSRAPRIALDLVDLAHMLPAGCRVLVTSSGQPATVTGYTAPSEDLPAGSVQLVTDDGQRWDCDARGLADAAGLPLVPSLVTWRERIARAKGKLQTISGLPGV